jgi:hypothetical protein
MKNNILALSIATAMVLPMAAQADIKISGTFQAEIGSISNNGGDRFTQNGSTDGALMNGGSNTLKFDIDEKLGGGLTAFARLSQSFSTFEGAGLGDRERYIGLAGSNGHIAFGRNSSAYKSVSLGYDTWKGTGLQARNGGGGMSGSAFGHSSYAPDAVQLGLNAGGVALQVQTITDEGSGLDGSYVGSLKYSGGNWEVFGAASHMSTAAADADNFKVGGKVQAGGLTAAIQYEDTEIATTAMGGGAAKYLFGSLDYKTGNVSVGGWVAQRDADDATTDAFSYALGARYHFSKRTQAYLGYRDTDSETNTFDQDVFLLGMMHDF